MSACGDSIPIMSVVRQPFMDIDYKSDSNSNHTGSKPSTPSSESNHLSNHSTPSSVSSTIVEDCTPQPVPSKDTPDTSRTPACLFAVFYLLFTAFYGAILFHGSALLLAIWFPRLFRYVVDALLLSWLRLAEVVIHKALGIRVRHFGDEIFQSSSSNPRSSILLLNHRTQLDWFFIWGLGDPVQQMKIILKDSLAKVPGAGWAMQCGSFVFLRRRISVDLPRLNLLIQYVLRTKDSCQLLMFPEGTDLNPVSIARSDEFARKSNLPKLRYTLHPRSTGFLYLIEALSSGNLTEVYDVTVGYPDTLPSPETDIFKGFLPKEVHYHVQRFSICDLPTDAQGLTEWLQQRWLIKENMLKEYYAKSPKERRFADERPPDSIMFRVSPSDTIEWTLFGLINTGFWIMTSILWVYLLLTSYLGVIHVVLLVLVYIYLSYRCEGVTPWAARYVGLEFQPVQDGHPKQN